MKILIDMNLSPNQAKCMGQGAVDVLHNTTDKVHDGAVEGKADFSRE